MNRFLIALTGLLLSCGYLSAQEYSWQTSPMDGSITGCVAATAENVNDALGSVSADGTYLAPSGKTYPAYSTTAKVASIVLAAQPDMVDLKKVVAYSEAELPHMKTEGSLSNWFVSIVMDKVSELAGRKIDVGICNFGGIRKGMPQGDVLLDDIQSMFPFKNYLVHLEMTGSELRKVMQSMAESRFQAIGGVKVEVADRKLVSVLVGGEPLDDEKVYNVATISFLLTGGDGLKLEDNALKINSYDVMIFDAVMEHVEHLTKQGKAITSTDERHVIIR